MFFGAIVSVIGIIFLLHNLGILEEDAWEIIWPIIIIMTGVIIFIRQFFPKQQHEHHKSSEGR